MVFINIFHKMFKLDLILQIMNQTDHCLSKYELGGKVMKKFVGLRAKIQSYLRDDGSEDKKLKVTKDC